MHHWSVIVLLGLMTSSYVKGQIFPFDCRRPGTDCVSPATCNTGNTPAACVCGSDKTGYDCGLPSSITNCASKTCENGGTCYQDTNNADACYCTVDFSGDTCQNKRVDFQCGIDYIQVNTVDPPGFSSSQGVLKVKDQICDLASGLPKVVTKAASSETPAANCADLVTEDPNNANIIQLDILVQYESKIATTLDFILSLKCDITNPTTITLEPTSVPVDSASLQRTETASTSAIVDEMLVEARAPSTTTPLDPNTPLTIGDDSTLYYELEVRVITHFLLWKVVASNGMTGSDLMEVTLIENGCLAPRVGKIFKSFVTGDVPASSPNPAKKTLTATYSVFKMQTASNNLLKFTSMIKFCITAAQCQRSACSSHTDVTGADKTIGFGDSARRRRRSNEDGEIKTVNITYLVQPSNALPILGGGVDASGQDSCLRNIVFLLPLILLSIMLLLTMAIAVFFCSKVLRQNKLQEETNMGYKA